VQEIRQTKKRKDEKHVETLCHGKFTETLRSLLVEQPPASENDAQWVNRNTGLTLDQLDYMERLCRQELVDIPAGAPNAPLKLSPRNRLLLTFKWLRRYPPFQDLAHEFKLSRKGVEKYVSSVMNILDTKLEYLRRWPRQNRSKILTGPLKGTIGAAHPLSCVARGAKLLMK